MSNAANPTAKPKSRGGPDFHKPGCGCNACVARRRKAEAIANGTGPGGNLPAVQQAGSETILSDVPQAKRGLMRHRVKMWLKWKAIEPDLTHKEAAARLGIAQQTLTNTIHIATKEGWLKFEDPLNELRYEIMPMVTKGLKYHLEQGDKDIIIKTAQGTIFKQFLDKEGIKEAPPTTILALKIEMPASPQQSTIVSSGRIVGAPKEIIEAEFTPNDDSN